MFFKSASSKPAAPLVGRNLKLAWYIFGLACFLLLIGIAVQLLPIVDIVITPKYESLNINTTVQVDLDLPDIITPIGIVPGRLLPPNQDKNNFVATGYSLYETPKGTVVVRKFDLEQSIKRIVSKSVPEDQAVIPGSLEISWGEVGKITNPKFFNVPVNIKFNSYSMYPLDRFKKHLVGMSLPEAYNWLKRQQGIKDVKISFYPEFFTKISQKFPDNPKLIRFTLDN